MFTTSAICSDWWMPDCNSKFPWTWGIGTVPAKLLLQLTTAFQNTGLCDRTGTFFYKDHIHKNNIPILALGGDRDLVCPPEAVYGILLLPPILLYIKIVHTPQINSSYIYILFF